VPMPLVSWLPDLGGGGGGVHEGLCNSGVKLAMLVGKVVASGISDSPLCLPSWYSQCCRVERSFDWRMVATQCRRQGGEAAWERWAM
jgi:hypothetical protein